MNKAKSRGIKLKSIGKVLFVVFCLLFLIFTPFFVFNKDNYKMGMFFNLSHSSKVVLTLYHIETFEGGTNSRTTYLNKRAEDFNKQNPNVFIVIKSMDKEELLLNLEDGKRPDMFSFGVGVGEYIVGFLAQLNKNASVREDLQEFAKWDNKILAYPYILSGYCVLSHADSDNNDISTLLTPKNQMSGFSYSKTDINPVQALNVNGINYLSTNGSEFNSTYDAYLNFVNKKSVSLIGTMRDVARCKNREANFSLSNITYNMLGGYSDLIQYVSVVDNANSNRTYFSKLFAEFLLSEKSQSSLKSYGLFGTSKNKIYDTGYMSQFEDILLKNLTGVNVFKKV